MKRNRKKLNEYIEPCWAMLNVSDHLDGQFLHVTFTSSLHMLSRYIGDHDSHVLQGSEAGKTLKRHIYIKVLSGGLADRGSVAPDSPDMEMERARSLGRSYSSMDMEWNRGRFLRRCIGTEDTKI